ncbi:hypothetical protein [Gloeobacter violaceus]|uniref:Gll4154 protein n=1 Tax=Gloeobacter violaceus (strain ATCC 29082 / PCC 7421) TaxID=251221 RepID=Q7NDS8_GLOVI|nr:hypothetical protein [Gloeobacter violaceus]BAC92095.1 gll4154 [Gloeobacter violaceus PCC 7421]
MKKFAVALITAALSFQAIGANAQPRIPTKIFDTVTRTYSEGSIFITVGKEAELYDENGQLLEKLPFKRRVTVGKEGPTVSDYVGENYVLTFDEVRPSLSTAAHYPGAREKQKS